MSFDPLSLIPTGLAVLGGAVAFGVMRAEIANVKGDVQEVKGAHEQLERLEEERHTGQARDRHEDTLARGRLEQALAKIEGLLQGRGGTP